MAFSEACYPGHSLGIPVSSYPALGNFFFNQLNKAKISAILPLSDLIAERSLHIMWHMMCCTWSVLDMLQVICTWLCTDRLSVCVEDSSQCSEETVERKSGILSFIVTSNGGSSKLIFSLILVLLSFILILLSLQTAQGDRNMTAQSADEEENGWCLHNCSGSFYLVNVMKWK